MLCFVVAVVGVIKLALEAGKATPAPPVGPALGSKGVNIMAFCKDYNARTADKPGYVIPVEITVFDVTIFSFSLISSLYFFFSFPYVLLFLQDKSFTFILKTPPASVLLLKAAGILFSHTLLILCYLILCLCGIICLNCVSNSYFNLLGFATNASLVTNEASCPLVVRYEKHGTDIHNN